MSRVLEYLGHDGFAPAGRSQWLALADALDGVLVTLQMGVPDPLWFGPSRQHFDQNAEHVMHLLRTARWEVLEAEMTVP